MINDQNKRAGKKNPRGTFTEPLGTPMKKFRRKNIKAIAEVLSKMT